MSYSLAVGTYEKLLYGFDISISNKKLLHKLLYVIPAHISGITAIACNGTFLATGSSDDSIRIFNVKIRKEVGIIYCTKGTILSLSFWKDEYLYVNSDDGYIYIYRCKDWQLINRLFVKHQKVYSMAIHPSGKLGISLSSDKKLILWNLVQLKQAAISKLSSEAIRIKFSPNGHNYALLCKDRIIVYDMKSFNILADISVNGMHDFVFINDDIIAYAGEDKNIYIYEFSKQESITISTKHKYRIKSLSIQTLNDKHDVITSVSSDGLICFWKMKNLDLILVGHRNINCRVTCITSWQKSNQNHIEE